MKTARLASILVLAIHTSITALAAEKKPLTNADVIKMTKAELPEATMILAIQANPHDFDQSVDALIELKAAGVPAKVVEAMLQPSAPPAATPAPEGTSSNAPVMAADQKTRPYAFAIAQNGEKHRLQPTPFKIIATKAKGHSVAMLLTESAVTEVAGGVVMDGAVNAILATGGQFAGTIGGAVVGITGMIGKKVFKSDEITLTYVCALGARQANTSVTADNAQFELHYADVFGADPDEFEPTIVKVSPTPKNWRLIAAIKAKRTEFSDDQPRPLEIIEERVAASNKKIGRGHVIINPLTPLAPGEYAVVLRPIKKEKSFVLHEVEQEQNEGLILRSVWDFSVQAPPAPADQKL